MCGINGILVKRNNILDMVQRIQNMNRSIAHRGPDADSHVVLEEGRVALGHRRLSILDLDSRSNQPFVSASGRWMLVYNGEIYNYQDLKSAISYPFKTRSDTEVLAACLETWGVGRTLEACNGMFAFAAYDTHSHKLYLCRDRLGIKPLYYYKDENHLIFSSEIKGVLNSGLVNASLELSSIDDYMAYRYVREAHTLFEGIRQVEAGTYLEFDDDFNVQCRCYWGIPETFDMDISYDEEKIADEFRQRLEGAVRKRMISDVPLGTYLSGGVDSSLLSAITAEQSGAGVNTYTIGFSELNEFPYARLVAEKYQTAHHEIHMDWQDYQKRMKEVIEYKDAPLGIPNEVPLAIMSEELKKDITVVLSGEGADELLGGYGRIFRTPFDYANVDKECGKSFYQYFINKYEYVPRKIREKYLVGGTRRNEYDSVISNHFESHCNEYNVFWFFHKYHVKGLLQRVDATTMLAGVEARVPFLDHELLEYVYEEVPYDLKLKWNSGNAIRKATRQNAATYSECLDSPKYLLKKIAYQYLPSEIIERKKVGFPVPLNEWNAKLKGMAKEFLPDAKWMNGRNLEGLLQDCRQERIGNQIIWMFLNMELFYQSYFTKEWRY